MNVVNVATFVQHNSYCGSDSRAVYNLLSKVFFDVQQQVVVIRIINYRNFCTFNLYVASMPVNNMHIYIYMQLYIPPSVLSTALSVTEAQLLQSNES